MFYFSYPITKLMQNKFTNKSLNNFIKLFVLKSIGTPNGSNSKMMTSKPIKLMLGELIKLMTYYISF